MRERERQRERRTSQSTEPLRFASYYEDPVGFARDVFGITLVGRQAELARAVAGSILVACRSGHKVGKSCVDCCVAWWFACTREESRVVITAPTERQIKKVLWRELKRLRRLAFKKGYELPAVPKDPATGIQFEDGREIFGFSTKEPDNFSGISGAEVLYVVDEASGVKEEIFQAINGNRAGGARLLMTGNPTQTSGEFYDAFHTKRHLYDAGALIHISSADSPNVEAGRTVVPGLAEGWWVEEQRKRYGGPGNPIYDVRVDGNFPAQATDSIIGVALVEAALARWEDVESGESDEIKPGNILDVGVDVARFGDDDTVVQPRRGLVAYAPASAHGFDNLEVTGLVIRTVEDLRQPGERVRIKVDVTGGHGSGPYDLLRAHYASDPQLSKLVQIIPVNASSASSEPEEYFNLRAELHYAVRDWLDAGGTFPSSPELESDLVAPKYSLHTNGSRKVEPKEAIKKRLGRSTDYYDALALSVWNGAVVDTRPAEDAIALILSDPRFQLSRFGGGGRGFG